MSDHLPANWIRIRISAFCSIRTGIAFSTNDVVDRNEPGAIPCFRTSNIQEELETTDVTYIPERLVRARDYSLRVGDILMSTANSNSLVGKCCLIRRLDEASLYGGFISRVRIESNLLDPEFAYLWLSSSAVQAHLRQRARQTTNIANLPPGDVLSTPIVVPPLSEQRQIVEFLNGSRDIRRLRQLAEELSSQLIPAIFYEMFAGEDGYRHWPDVAIKQVVASADYGTSKAANENGIGVPCLRMNNVTYAGGLDLAEIKHVELSERELQKQLLRKSDVLFNRTNSLELVGKTGLWDASFEAVAASYFVRLRLNLAKVDPRYLVAFLNLPSTKRRLQNMAKQAIGMSNINATELQRVRMPLPPIELQIKFGERLDSLRDYQMSLRDSVVGERRLNQSLLAYAFSGELTANWRKTNRELLKREASDRDQWLHENGIKLTLPDARITDSLKKTDERHQELNREQRKLLEQIQNLDPNESGGTFTLSSLVKKLEEPLDTLPVDAVRRHLDVLVSLGLIKAISQRAGGGGSVGLAFGNAYRLPRANKAEMANSLEPDLVKSTERERLMRIGKKTLRNRDALELARALIDEQELTNPGVGDE
jgi:type I restriction enzyme S subunit